MRTKSEIIAQLIGVYVLGDLHFFTVTGLQRAFRDFDWDFRTFWLKIQLPTTAYAVVNILIPLAK